MNPVKVRMASANDAKAVADLHAESWRRHYRGAYLDSFLDGDVFTDRWSVWSERLSHPKPEAFTVVADDQGSLVGFAHTVMRHDPRFGALLDNLHVRHDCKRRGIGKTLMRRTATILIERDPGSGLYLWVLEQNKDAQAFYSDLGGVCTGREILGPFPGGGRAVALRMHWPDPAVVGR
jgi:ribosomal protein S18 acetylase RimI-like enzyme